MQFDNLGLASPLLRAVRDAGYQRPTPIQLDAIPPALAGRDILGCAQTGTGKTAAFALPLLQHMAANPTKRPRLRALVVTPTRELAAQIDESFGTYGRYLELRHTVIFGGVKDRPQKAVLRCGVDVLVATPGRLLDLMGQGVVDLDGIEFFVLDEADRMLDMGFLPDVRRITARLPRQRQTLFFSATLPGEIQTLARSLLNNPVSVAVARVSAPADHVTHRLFFVDKANKRRLLLDLVRQRELTRTLVFSRTKHGANRIAQILEREGVHTAALHGNKSQGARTRALEGFRRGDLRVLVATDLAARGLDVEGISHVVNFDLPNVAETYVHRIGRTARAGAAGIALSFCDVDEREFLVDIERLMGQHLERVDEHDYPPSQPKPPMTQLTGRRRPTSSSAAPASRRRSRKRSTGSAAQGPPPSQRRRGGNRRGR